MREMIITRVLSESYYYDKPTEAELRLMSDAELLAEFEKAVTAYYNP